MVYQGTTMPIGSYKEATGEIGYGMTNDYIFRAVLQKNVKVLKGNFMGGIKNDCRKNPNMTEATQTLYEMNADAITQEKCRARREYYRR